MIWSSLLICKRLIPEIYHYLWCKINILLKKFLLFKNSVLYLPLPKYNIPCHNDIDFLLLGFGCERKVEKIFYKNWQKISNYLILFTWLSLKNWQHISDYIILLARLITEKLAANLRLPHFVNLAYHRRIGSKSQTTPFCLFSLSLINYNNGAT